MKNNNTLKICDCAKNMMHDKWKTHSYYRETSRISSTVVKMDTASCDNVHGSSRSEINGETVVRRRTIVNKDNGETSRMSSTVVKKDTASCDIVHGSSRSKINGETIMR